MVEHVEHEAEKGGGDSGLNPGSIHTLTWSIRPCTIGRGRCVWVVGVIVLFAVLVALALQDVFMALLSALILFGSLHSYFLTTHYVLSQEGVEVKGAFGTQKKEWKTFKTFWVDRSGVSLSPFLRRSWLEHYRGVRLLFRGNEDEVVDFVTRMMGEESRRGQRVAAVS